MKNKFRSAVVYEVSAPYSPRHLFSTQKEAIRFIDDRGIPDATISGVTFHIAEFGSFSDSALCDLIDAVYSEWVEKEGLS